MKRKGKVALSIGVAASVILGGIMPVHAASKTTVVFSTWGAPSELLRYKQFIANFEKSNPSINVVLQPVADYTQYHAKLLTELATGKAPDVFYLGDDKVGKYVQAGVLMPLNSMLNSSSSTVKLSDFSPSLLGSVTRNGNVYGVPNDVNPDAWWYDKTVLTKAGITDDPATLAAQGKWTTAAYNAMATKIAAAGATPLMAYHYWGTYWAWITSQGGTVYDKNGNFVANKNPVSVAAIATLAKMVQDKTMAIADDQPSGDSSDNQFVEHKVGFYPEGRYVIGTVSAAGSKDSYDIAPWPTPSGKAAPTDVAASFLAINGKTKVKDAAFKFWSAYVGKAGQIFRLSTGGNAVPSIQGVDSIVTSSKYPAHAQTFLDMVHIGYTNAAIEATVPGLSDDIAKEMRAIYAGTDTAQAGLDKIAALVTAAQKKK